MSAFITGISFINFKLLFYTVNQFIMVIITILCFVIHFEIILCFEKNPQPSTPPLQAGCASDLALSPEVRPPAEPVPI